MKGTFIGWVHLAAAVGMSLFGIWLNTVGLTLSYQDLDGVFAVMPLVLAVLAAVFCPVLASLLAVALIFFVFPQPPWYGGALFLAWWILLLLHWRLTHPPVAERKDLRLFVRDALRMLKGGAGPTAVSG